VEKKMIPILEREDVIYSSLTMEEKMQSQIIMKRKEIWQHLIVKILSF
jgi:hypothetical protein